MQQQIDRIAAAEIDPASFAQRYLAPGRPCVVTGVTAGWRAAREWVTPAGKPDWALLRAEFGHLAVPVVTPPPTPTGSALGSAGGYGEGVRAVVPLSEFVDLVAASVLASLSARTQLCA